MGAAQQAVTRTFEQLEQVIERGLETFVEVGQALIEIRDRALHKADYPTFEDYCLERWGWKRAHAYRLMNAAQVMENLSPMGDIPQNERQVRPLTSLEPDAQREVWSAAVAENGPQPTAKQIMAEVIRRVKAALPPPEPDPPRDLERERELAAFRVEAQANSIRNSKVYSVLEAIEALAAPKLPIPEVADWIARYQLAWGVDLRGQTDKAAASMAELLKELRL